MLLKPFERRFDYHMLTIIHKLDKVQDKLSKIDYH